MIAEAADLGTLSRADASPLRALVGRPELRPLIGSTELAMKSLGDLPFIVPAPRRLILSPHFMDGAEGATHLRHGLELAWLRGIIPDAPALCGILAARTAALFAPTRSAETPWLDGLAGAMPDRRTLAVLWSELARLQPGSPSAADEAIWDILAGAWDLALPAETLMLTGGDERLAVDPVSQLNRYGSGTRPRPQAISFASCTASSISERGYGAAEACRRRLLRAALGGQARSGAATESAYLRAGILDHYDLGGEAEAILSPSGTDATLLATGLLQAARPGRKHTSILMSPFETGSGIPNAVTGRHFGSRNASGHKVTAGAYLDGFAPEPDLVSIALRDADGRLIPKPAVAEVLLAALDRATSTGHAALHLLDTSKTGLQAPQAALITALQQRYGDRLDIVIDACQARLGRKALKTYLAAGCIVLLTGSKFFTGPAFSGVILTPRARFNPAKLVLAPGLAAYTAATDWAIAPQGLSFAANPGLLLRWAAALAEMKGFAAVPARRQALILNRFGVALRRELARDPRLIACPNPAPERPDPEAWDAQPTIFPFMLRNPDAPDTMLDQAALSRVHRWLYQDLSDQLPGALAARPCHIGQPVQLGGKSGLRIAAGARLISGEPSHARLEDNARLDQEIADLGQVIAKIGLILNHWAVLSRG